MARKYNVSGNCVTGTGSATLPIMNVVSATTVRPMIYDVFLGFTPTPVDFGYKFAFQRGTTAGTWGGAGGTAITPQAIDSGDPAALATANQGICSVGPTLTANAFLLQWGQNSRATVRWLASPGGELILPAAVNSLNLMALVAGSSIDAAFTVMYTE